MVAMVATFSILIPLAVIIVWLVARRKRLTFWLPGDLLRWIRIAFTPRPKGAVHIMFAFVDHFEPGNRNAPPEQQIRRMDDWVDEYPRLAGRHRDSDGVPPQHTFFFPPHYDQHGHLEKLTELCTAGYGEIELHLHHDRQEPWPDDEESLRKKIIDCLDSFSRCGVFCLPDGTRTYGFIHGDWALANSLSSGEHCGVNDELTILEQTGCYADFTFPVSNEAQPRLANTFFYGQSCREHPKGYDTMAEPVVAGKAPGLGLLFAQGPIGLRWRSRTHRFKPSIEQANIDVKDYPFAARIDYWINKRIHVPGRPEWLFVKIHTHGVREEDREVLLGKPAENMYSHLESKYNDENKYLLHYVSAREMYNIIKAAEAGESGNPNEFRDYLIPRYVYLPKRTGET
jgi:hypothetical protein